jgi:hypothetical protein
MMLGASALGEIGFIVPGSGQSRLGRIPAQPARSRTQPNLRAGFVTMAAERDVELTRIMGSRHKAGAGFTLSRTGRERMAA